jgi:hypothetical protein
VTPKQTRPGPICLSLPALETILEGVDPDIFDQRFHVAMAFYPRQVRRELLRILELPDEERVREIGQLYQAGTIPGLAELLLDLEEDGVGQQVRLTMIQQLHRLEREARPEAG